MKLPRTGRAQRRLRVPSAVLLILVILVAGGSFWGWRYWRRLVMERNEAHAAACLKLLSVAEVDFRNNDRDNNRINDFWTADVASLYPLVPASSLPGAAYPIQLVERALAEADTHPIQPLIPNPLPYRGYFFRAMMTDESGARYQSPSGSITGPTGSYFNTSKFGICAYPANYPSSGRWTYIVNEGNSIFKMDTDGKPMAAWPRDRAAERSYLCD